MISATAVTEVAYSATAADFVVAYIYVDREELETGGLVLNKSVVMGVGGRSFGDVVIFNIGRVSGHASRVGTGTLGGTVAADHNMRRGVDGETATAAIDAHRCVLPTLPPFWRGVVVVL